MELGAREGFCLITCLNAFDRCDLSLAGRFPEPDDEAYAAVRIHQRAVIRQRRRILAIALDSDFAPDAVRADNPAETDEVGARHRMGREPVNCMARHRPRCAPPSLKRRPNVVNDGLCPSVAIEPGPRARHACRAPSRGQPSKCACIGT